MRNSGLSSCEKLHACYLHKHTHHTPPLPGIALLKIPPSRLVTYATLSAFIVGAPKSCVRSTVTPSRGHTTCAGTCREPGPGAAATTPWCVYSSESLLSRQARTSTCLNPGSSVTTGVARTPNHYARSFGSALVFVHGLVEPDLRDLVPVFWLNFSFCRFVSFRYETSRQYPPPVFASVVFNCIAHPKCCFAV